MNLSSEQVNRLNVALNEAELVPFELEEMLKIVESFEHHEIYGWKFFNLPNPLDGFENRLSLDWTSGAGEHSHSITLFQEVPHRILDICIWFESMEIFKPDGRKMSIEEFIAGGKCWWDGLYADDPRTEGFGIKRGGLSDDSYLDWDSYPTRR